MKKFIAYTIKHAENNGNIERKIQDYFDKSPPGSMSIFFKKSPMFFDSWEYLLLHFIKVGCKSTEIKKKGIIS